MGRSETVLRQEWRHVDAPLIFASDFPLAIRKQKRNKLFAKFSEPLFRGFTRRKFSHAVIICCDLNQSSQCRRRPFIQGFERPFMDPGVAYRDNCHGIIPPVCCRASHVTPRRVTPPGSSLTAGGWNVRRYTYLSAGGTRASGRTWKSPEQPSLCAIPCPARCHKAGSPADP